MTLEVVSENTDAEIARKRAAERVEWATRALVANMLRVIRGGGKPYEIGRQAIELADAVIAHDEISPSRPHTFPIQEALQSYQPWPVTPDRDELSVTLEYEREAMIRGALQITASRLLGQKTQESAGRTELMEAMLRIQQAYEVARKERVAAERLVKDKVARQRASRRLFREG